MKRHKTTDNPACPQPKNSLKKDLANMKKVKSNFNPWRSPGKKQPPTFIK